jgi:hypothetical protein
MEWQLVSGVREVPCAEWNALVGEESPFLEWGWLASLEEAGCVGERSGWAARPLVAREHGRLVAACPVYVKGHSEGEFVYDWSWADAAQRAGLAYYPKLLVGVPFTPVTGARVLTASGADRAALLADAARALVSLCRANRLSGVHVNFCRDDERAAFEAEGFHPRLGFQYHWHNAGCASFDDYLARLRSKRRNQVKRERRSLAEQDVAIRSYVGDEIGDELFAPMFEVYRVTVDNHPWGRRYLNRRFFALLREHFRARLCFIVARRGEEIVGGTVNVQKGDALYGRYWGALVPLPNLHFNVSYYAGIAHCIERGLARFEPGAGGEYKQLRGFDATPTWSCHWLADARFAEAVAKFLEREREQAAAAIESYRDRSANKT